MSAYEKIYSWLPHGLKAAAISLLGLRNLWLRHGAFFREKSKELEQNLLLSRDRLQEIQLEKLRDLLLENIEHSQYYARVCRDCRITRDDIVNAGSCLELLARFPLLSKETLKAGRRSIVSRRKGRRRVGYTYTSGSTGTPLRVEIDRESLQTYYAQWRRYHHWLGLGDAFSTVRFSGRIIVHPRRRRPPFWVYNPAERQLFMSTYHLTEDNLPCYVEELNAFAPDLIDGYPSAIHVLSDFILKRSVRLRFTPKAISTTAETLLDHQRESMEKAFGCRVYNQYASSEGAPWIVQCRAGNMHLWTDTGVFEFVDRREFAGDTVSAELLVTSFSARKTPLVRYRIGDRVLIQSENGECPCGSHFPFIKAVLGRMDDILYTAEKGYVGRLDTAYKGLRGIKRSKIVQTDIGHAVIYIVKDEDFTEAVPARLLGNLKARLGEGMHLEVRYVAAIPLDANGKFRAVEREFRLDGFIDLRPQSW
jgi:phenylacetate-CoA ligase